MDALISSALQEICSRGLTGISLSSLWPTLNPAPSPSLKASLWTNLRLIPSLQFTVAGKDAPVSADDSRIHQFEDAERLDLKIVAKEHLRDNFLGLYETPTSIIVPIQRRALELLAIARTSGITQTELANELGIVGKDFFYRVRKLESQKLIVRQPALLKTKETGFDGETKNAPHVMTNLIFLPRYAKHLGVQQRFEINKREQAVENYVNGDEMDVVRGGFAEEALNDDVLVKDFLPAMKSVCDKLEKANNKVLVVSDIKQELGYSGAFGHRAWRSVCRRLKDACLIEEFEAKVNDKIERCVRLLKDFSLTNFEDKTLGGHDDCLKEQLMKFGRRFCQTEQLVEIPIDRQIYDIIEAEGTKGAIGLEVSGRLGLHNKSNHYRFDNLVSKFGVHKQKENLRKTSAYRFWTSGNLNSESMNSFPGTSKVLDENLDAGYVPISSHETLLEYDHPTLNDLAMPEKQCTTDTKISHGSIEDGKVGNMILCLSKVPEDLHEGRGASSEAEIDLLSKEVVAPSEIIPYNLPKPPNFRLCLTNPNQSLTADGAIREQRILERLEDEKFILRPEIHKWLATLEKDKSTTLDRKTVDRILIRLQDQGLCKCVTINVPAVTNCGHNRPTVLVLHPSIESSALDVGEIHDKVRSFEKQVRGQGLSRLKSNDSIPVLNGVTRNQIRGSLDERISKIDTMRANGFVLAKMLRVKLLHNFLWDYISNFPGWDDVFSSKTSVSTCKFFALETAIDAIPIELFFQVAGSHRKLDNMREKSKKGLRLSDLSSEEYNSLKDTQATGRLSLIIDILRRLKLIRLIRDEHSEGAHVPSVTFTHAIELKPYIEEPVSMVASSNFRTLDLRPRIRHDFILSNREAVDEYWKTLEYCYAAADPRAALYAFPGSAVPEVLRIHYDKNQQRLRRYEGSGQGQPPSRKRPSSRKRKKTSERSSKKHARVDTENKQIGEQTTEELQDNVDQFMEESSLGDHDINLPMYQEDNYLETVDEGEPNEDSSEPTENGEHYSLITEYAISKVKQTRPVRFPWTEESDRRLVIQYVRQRVVLGAKFQRIDWTRVHDLPAPPRTCARRMAALNRNIKFRKAVMRLCTILSERYAKHLEKTCNRSLNSTSGKVLLGLSTKACYGGKFSNGDSAEEAGFEEQWDDFSDKIIRKGLEDIFRCKEVAKLKPSKNVGSAPKMFSDVNTNNEYNLGEPELFSSTAVKSNVHNHGLGRRQESRRRSRSHRIHQKFMKLLNEGTSVSTKVHESLAVSNAVELLKLVFLSTSTAPDLKNLLAETLRRYSEHDLFAAFSYLRDRKIMIGGNGGPFVLSQHFLHSVFRSPFPVNTGKRALRLSHWLHEREKELIEKGINLPEDLQCGDIFQLFALVSSGEMSISPCMPEEGVGEAEDFRSLKRKADEDEFHDGDKSKRLKPLVDSELFSRKEKGFPGIRLSLHRLAVPVVNVVEHFKDAEACLGELDWNVKFNDALGKKDEHTLPYDSKQDLPNFDEIVPMADSSSKSIWEAMAGYVAHVTLKSSDSKQRCLIDAEVFRSVYSAIKKAGDQGLSMEEISQVIDMQGEDMHGTIVDVLEAFGQVLKVNAFESIHVVDALYHSKYFLTSMAGYNQDNRLKSAMKSTERSGDMQPNSQLVHRSNDGHPISSNNLGTVSSPKDAIMNDPDVHKVTILNLPEDCVPLNESQDENVHKNGLQDAVLGEKNVVLPGQPNEGETTLEFSCSKAHMPILPWINGDGTVNKVVYCGLIRRVLGILMQHPGILEEDIIHQVDVLNPQSCRSLLELMILDKHLIVRNMHQSTSAGPPGLLRTLLGNSCKESKSVYRKHFFANPMSASML